MFPDAVTRNGLAEMATEVDSPEHYKFGQLEAWDIIEIAVEGIKDSVTAYHVASALKYLTPGCAPWRLP